MLNFALPEPDYTDCEPAAAQPSTADELVFRDYRLFPRARTLLKHGQTVPIGSRAFDILHALLVGRGTIVSKDEIVTAAWPSTFVDESNLRFQIAQLRKALGPDRDLVKTIPGRGYLLCAEGPDTPSNEEPEAGMPPAETQRLRLVPLVVDQVADDSGTGGEDEARWYLQAFLRACGLRAARPVILLVDMEA